jgi:hypothetical protein
MRSKFLPGMWLWLKFGNESRSLTAGSLSLILIFIFVLFSALGLGLVVISDIHTKFSRYRRDTTLMAIAAENGIKNGYDVFARALLQSDGPKTISSMRYEALRSDCQSGGTDMLAEAMGVDFPLGVSGVEGALSWAASVDVTSVAPVMQDSFVVAEFHGVVRSEGRLAGLSPSKATSLDAAATAMAGYLPLSRFPFLVAADLAAEEKRTIQDNREMVVLPSRWTYAYPRKNFSSETTIPRDAGPLLKKALNIKIFSPEKLTRAEIRSALGLEMVNEPVPEGVYLIENDTGLGGLFLQGDVDEIILATEAGFQVVSIRRGNDRWLLKYCPAQSSTTFTTPTETRTYDRIPLGMILVNGRVGALGGGL